MKSNDKVYLRVMNFHKNYEAGKYENESSATIEYSKEEAINNIFEYMKKELWYFTDERGDKGVKNLIADMHREKCSCELYINEYSCRRECFFDQHELYKRFHQVVTSPSECLYEDLLALVDHQRYYLNSFGEVTRVVTIPQKINGKEIGFGIFKEEDCKAGYYGGSFKYVDGTEKETVKAVDGKLYFGHLNINRKNLDEKDKTCWERYAECFYTEEEAARAAILELERKMLDYVEDKRCSFSPELLKEFVKEKVWRMTLAVWVVSNQRKQFDVLKDMTRYYTDNIKMVKPEKRYDFLLSLLRFDERVYDVDGTYVRSDNKHQFLKDQWTYRLVPEFSKETADKLNFNI